jgi:circadian clock protein KaiC
MGPAGAGKSALTTQYVVAAARRGEKSAMFLFEESMGSLLNRASSLGLPMQEFIDKGLINIRQVDPAQLQPGEFAHLVSEAVEEQGIRVLVIDSLNGYLNAVPEERFLLLHLHELLSYLGQHGVASILVFAQHGLIGSMHSSVDVSYLADCVVLLRYYEAEGRIHKAISVVKKRSGPHETAIRSFTMGANGIEVGPALSTYHGVLSGIPNFDRTLHARIGAE